MNRYRSDLAFLRLICECCFHPSRDASFPSLKVKWMALSAMFMLWEKKIIFLFGKIYGRRMIRSVIIEQMMPEHLDNAVNFFVHSKELTTVKHLAELIFACIVHDGTMTDIQFEHDFGGAREKILSLP